MAKCGKKGSIIVNTSVGGSRVCRLPEMRGMGVHAATKAGADMLMKYGAVEVSPLVIRVDIWGPWVRVVVHGRV